MLRPYPRYSENPENDRHPARQIIGVATAGTFAAILAVIASGGGHKAPERDVDSQAALQHAIRPTMVRIAKQATGLVAEDPAIALKATVRPGETRLVATRDQDGLRQKVKVVMGEAGPADVEYVEIDTAFRGPDGALNQSTDYLAVPGAGPSSGRTVVTDKDPTGWSAGTVGTISVGGEAQPGEGYAFDSSDPAFFSMEGFQPTTSAATANYVVSHFIQPDFQRLADPR